MSEIMKHRWILKTLRQVKEARPQKNVPLCIIPLPWNMQNEQIPRDRKQMSSYQDWGAGGMGGDYYWCGTSFCGEKRAERRQSKMVMWLCNYTKTTELHALEGWINALRIIPQFFRKWHSPFLVACKEDLPFLLLFSMSPAPQEGEERAAEDTFQLVTIWTWKEHERIYDKLSLQWHLTNTSQTAAMWHKGKASGLALPRSLLVRLRWLLWRQWWTHSHLDILLKMQILTE
jgi:hypothetical protein